MPLQGLAVAAWKAMWELYDRKYGKYGESRVRALQADIVKLQRQIDELHNTLSAAEETMHLLETDLASADKEIAEWKRKYNEANAAANAVPVPENPYTEVTP